MAKDFRTLQKELAAHLRNPTENPPPAEVDERGLKVYRSLFINNISGFISRAFPVLHSLYHSDDWDSLIRTFYAQHCSHSPYFIKIAEEFLNYLDDEHTPSDCDPPFLSELAHYEWIEIALSTEDAKIDWTGIDRTGDVIANCPIISPLAWQLCYEWQVHRISPEYRPTEPNAEPTHLIIHRKPDDEIGFIEINAATSTLLENIEQSPTISTHQILSESIADSEHDHLQTLIDGARQTLEQLRKQDIILGTRPPTKRHA